MKRIVGLVVGATAVAGPPTNVQFMVKNSKKYATTAGWGFAQFIAGKPGDDVLQKTCFSCHASAKDRDSVFTRYAPWYPSAMGSLLHINIPNHATTIVRTEKIVASISVL